MSDKSWVEAPGKPDAEGSRDCVQVLVVGAGPTGLTAAAFLAQAGVDVRIIDKEPGAAKESRAFAVQARTLEVFLSIGLADAFLDRGVLANGTRVYVDGRSTAGFNLERLGRHDTPYPMVLSLPQSETEAILVEHLAAKGIEVERGLTAVSLEQDATGATLQARGADGAVVALRASYVIGADGAHSFVRKALGLKFEGAPYAQTFLLADCTLDGALEPGPFSVFFHGNHFALWFPLKGGRFGRVITTSERPVADASIAAQGSSPATLDEIEASFREATQLKVRLTDPVWMSRYRVHHRGVNRYGVGRVFVAGDAAHIHSPAAGQGMNTGIQDAANLAWKLSAVLKGRAMPALLDSYDAERRPVGDYVLSATDRLFSLATSPSGWVAAARSVLLPLAAGAIGFSGAARARAFEFLSELGIHYEPGLAVQDEAGEGQAWQEGPRPGRRAPDAAVSRKVSVFDIIAGYRFSLLAMTRKPLGAPEIERIAAELDAAAAASGMDVAAHLIGRSLVGRHPRLIQAESDDVLPAYGLGPDVPEALYLVRPDGYVAWRAPSLDSDGLKRFVAGRFAPVTPP